MDTIVSLSTEVIHRFVFEVRYDFGQLYWDRAGRVSRQILSAFENWDSDSVSITTSRLSNRELNMVFNFGPAKLDLAQTQDADVDQLVSVGEFAKIAEDATSIVIESLELEWFSRIGFRMWHLYPTSDRNEAVSRISELRHFRIDTQSSPAISNPTDIAYHVVEERSKNMLRIAISPLNKTFNYHQACYKRPSCA